MNWLNIRKRSALAVVLGCLVLGAAGCSSVGPNAKIGAVSGAALGAAAGGIIGHQSGRGLEGAAIGAGAGAIGGGVVGDAVDQKKRGY